MVADVIVETPDTSTLVFFTGNDRLDYTAGHFLTIDPKQFEALDRFTAFLEHLKGKPEPPRAYSMSSSPHERYLAVTVKEERFVPNVTKYPPLLSPLLVKRTVAGMRLVVTGFTGPYTLPADITSKTDHIVHLCAGSGSVPNLSILKFALVNHPTLRHTFIYSNKTWDDVIFRGTLAELEAHPLTSSRLPAPSVRVTTTAAWQTIECTKVEGNANGNPGIAGGPGPPEARRRGFRIMLSPTREVPMTRREMLTTTGASLAWLSVAGAAGQQPPLRNMGGEPPGFGHRARAGPRARKTCGSSAICSPTRRSAPSTSC